MMPYATQCTFRLFSQFSLTFCHLATSPFYRITNLSQVTKSKKLVIITQKYTVSYIVIKMCYLKASLNNKPMVTYSKSLNFVMYLFTLLILSYLIFGLSLKSKCLLTCSYIVIFR